MDTGFILLHRKLLEWEWYDDINTKSLFIHCLLKANHKDNNWRGQLIKRGQFFTSLNHLSFDLKLTTKQIRLSLEKLIKTNEIQSKGANKGTMITVCNYDSYQKKQILKDKQTDKERANKGQTEGKQRATNNNDKKGNNDNNDYKKILLSEIKISDLPNGYLEYYEIAISFYKLFEKNLTDAGANCNTLKKSKGTWIDDIRLLIEVDKYDVEKIRSVWQFLKTDEFWKKNILSASKLRKQFDKLLLNVKNNGQKQKKGVTDDQLIKSFSKHFGVKN